MKEVHGRRDESAESHGVQFLRRLDFMLLIFRFASRQLLQAFNTVRMIRCTCGESPPSTVYHWTGELMTAKIITQITADYGDQKNTGGKSLSRSMIETHNMMSP
jgi:hypothetical protein